MNPHLDQLQPYPFEKLRALFAADAPPAGLSEIRLHIGEPQHPTPQFIKDALVANLGGLASYPPSGSRSATASPLRTSPRKYCRWPVRARRCSPLPRP